MSLFKKNDIINLNFKLVLKQYFLFILIERWVRHNIVESHSSGKNTKMSYDSYPISGVVSSSDLLFITQRVVANSEF